jgi:quinol monooxygenase YgiN
VFLYEVYDDAAALEAHRATAHFKKFGRRPRP